MLRRSADHVVGLGRRRHGAEIMAAGASGCFARLGASWRGCHAAAARRSAKELDVAEKPIPYLAQVARNRRDAKERTDLPDPHDVPLEGNIAANPSTRGATLEELIAAVLNGADPEVNAYVERVLILANKRQPISASVEGRKKKTNA